MDEIIEKLENKINKINNDFKLIKNNINNQNYEVLELINDLNNNLDILNENLIDIKCFIFKNDLEKLNYLDQKEINEKIINEKINKIIKPIMLSLLLKFNNI